MESQDLFTKIKESKWAWLIYIPMTVPLVFAFMLSGTCLGPLVSAIIIFGIPYIFGVRGLGKFFKVGTVIVLISGIVFGIAFTSFIYDQSYLFEERTLGNDALTGGTVTPYQGDPGDTFNFTVTYKGTEPVENVSVFVNITNLGGGDLRNLTMNRSGNLFYVEEEFGNSLYFYRFDINLSSEGKWLHTQSGYGPLTMDYSEMLGIQVIQGIIFLFLWAGLFFYMVLVLYWWGTGARRQPIELEKAKEGEEEESEEDKEDGEEKEDYESEKDEEKTEEEPEEDRPKKVIEEFECTECGASVSADADVCPSCGEGFEDD